MSGAARTPPGLGRRGRSAWRALTEVYEFRPDETELLREFCAVLDVIEALRVEVEGAPALLPTPRDGQKINPLLTELRAQRKLSRELAAALKLSDAVDEASRVPAAGPWDRRSHRRRAV
jgi:hypothetical protein